jgi:hypothetical protein
MTNSRIDIHDHHESGRQTPPQKPTLKAAIERQFHTLRSEGMPILPSEMEYVRSAQFIERERYERLAPASDFDCNIEDVTDLLRAILIEYHRIRHHTPVRDRRGPWEGSRRRLGCKTVHDLHSN